MKAYLTFIIAPALLEPHHQIGKSYIQNTHWGEYYSSAETQSVYSIAPADGAPMSFDFRPNFATQ